MQSFKSPAPTPPFEFRLDPGSGVPTYLQLAQQVEHAVRLGYLVAEDQLPRVKDVVAALAINPNTVLKAYRELEHRGLAEGRPGVGTFVIGALGEVPVAEQAELREELRDWVAAATAAGLDEQAIVALFADALREAGREAAHQAGREAARQPEGAAS